MRPREESSKSFDELLAEAQNAARAGLYGKAGRLCSQALEKRPEDARAVMLCAIAACNSDDTHWAKHYYAMAGANQKHAIYNICSAKGIDVQKNELSVSKPDEVPANKTDELPGHKGKQPPAAETPGAMQRPRTGQPPGAAALRNLSTEAPVATRTEPVVPSRPDTGHPADARPGMLEPPRMALVPSAPVAEQKPRRRWPVWMPWTVVGAGVVVTGVGEVLYNVTYNEYDDFDKKFSELCPIGCNESQVPSDLTDQLDRARTLETMSRISMIAGGVTVVAGVALVFLNQTNEPTSERATARTFVVPSLGPNAAGIAAGISF